MQDRLLLLPKVDWRDWRKEINVPSSKVYVPNTLHATVCSDI